MTDINVNVRSSGGANFAENISVSHKMGITKKSEAQASDEIMQSTSGYREDRIPAADYPELVDVRSDLNSEQPRTSPDSPKGNFADNLKQALANIPEEQLAKLKQAFPNITSNNEALKLLLFAWNHPGIPLDPQIHKLLNELVKQAKEQTIKDLNLPANWSPPEPNSKKADERMAEFQDSRFNEFAHQLADNPADAAKLTAAYYHPETSEELSSDLKALLAECEKAAQSETKEKFGLPQGFNPPKDKLEYDLKLTAALYELFAQELNESPQTSGLTDNQKAQLRTLHSDPQAKVKDREKLLPFLKLLNAQAQAKLAQQFNLPENLKMMSNKEQYYLKASAQFLAEFEEKVNSQTSPPLTAAQKELLLATGGMQAGNLPPDLKALFNKLKNETISEIMDRYGLSRDWAPKSKTSDLQVKKADKKEESSKSEEAEETEDAWDSVSGFSMKGQREVKASTEKIDLEQLMDTAPPDTDMQKKVLNHYHEYTGLLLNFVNKFLNLSEVMGAGDHILTVHLALDTLRNTIYALQRADTDLQTKSALMQKEVTQLKILKQKEQLAEIRKQQSEHPKECFLYKVLDIICPVPVVKDVIEGFVKTFFYILDLVMGGMLNTIFQAAGSEPPGENPLALMGVDKSVTDNIDIVAGIIVAVVMLVIEIVISVLLCQPELIAMSIAHISASISAQAASVAVRVAMRAAQEALMQAALRSAGTLTQKEVTKIMEEAIEESLKQSAKAALKESTKKAIRDAAPEAAKALVKQEGKNIIKEAEKSLEKVGKKLIIKESKKGIKDFAKEGIEEAVDQVKDRGQQILLKMKKLLKIAEEEKDEGAQILLKQTKKAAGRESVAGKVLAKLDVLMEIHNQVSVVFQTTQSFVEFAMAMKKSDLHNKIAELQAEIEMLDADLQVLKKAMKMLQNVLEDCATWMADVNKQQSGIYQKMQVHFIAA